MTIQSIVGIPPAAVHDTQREGIRLGLILGTVTWLWVAIIDAIAGQPFHTFAVLGGIPAFTVVHYLLNIVFGITLIAVVHGAERVPSLMIGMVFVLLTFEGGVAMLTNLIAESPVGPEAWTAIFGGNVLSLAIAGFLISRKHPLGLYLRRAETEE
jgi:hypothetical protein